MDGLFRAIKKCLTTSSAWPTSSSSKLIDCKTLGLPLIRRIEDFMKTETRNRSSYLSAHDLQLGKRPIKIWGYDKSEDFVCRLEINSAGVAIFSGGRGGKKLGDYSWERLVRKLTK